MGGMPLATAARSARVLSSLAAGIDGLVLGAARAAVDLAVMPSLAGLERLRASAAFYLTPELTHEPARFFRFLEAPPPLPDVRLVPREWPPPGGSRWALSFPSEYVPANPDYRALHASFMENQTARADLWVHEDRAARGTVIGLHGFAMGHPALDAAALMAPALFASGLDVALLTLPFHGARSPREAAFSGAALAVADVPRMNEAIGQAAHDVARLAAWLRARGRGPVGLVGLSFGGYVAALMASLVDDLAFVVPIVAPVCLGALASRFMGASRRYRDRPGARLTLEEFRDAYRVHSPLARTRRLDRDRLLIVAALGDRIVPAEHALLLQEHWDDARIHWFAGSHIVPFGRRAVRTAIRRFLRDLGVV